MKKIVIGLFTLLAFVACDKNDDNGIDNSFAKNKLRVTKIKGSNKMWGENYTFIIQYNTKNQVDKAYAVNHEGDTVTTISNIREGDELTYTVSDFERDEDGKLIKDAQTRCKIVNKTIGGNLVSQAITTNSPKDVISDEDYEPEKYINVAYDKYVYEYSVDGMIKNVRIMNKAFNVDPADGYADNELYEVKVSKSTLFYQNDRLQTINNYVSDELIEDANYRLNQIFTLNYANDKISDILSDKSTDKVVFVYSGSDVKVNGIVYTLNAEGFVTKIVDNKGVVTNVEYELGNGNFETLSPIYNHLTGIPHIK